MVRHDGARVGVDQRKSRVGVSLPKRLQLTSHRGGIRTLPAALPLGLFTHRIGSHLQAGILAQDVLHAVFRVLASCETQLFEESLRGAQNVHAELAELHLAHGLHVRVLELALHRAGGRSDEDSLVVGPEFPRRIVRESPGIIRVLSLGGLAIVGIDARTGIHRSIEQRGADAILGLLSINASEISPHQTEGRATRAGRDLVDRHVRSTLPQTKSAGHGGGGQGLQLTLAMAEDHGNRGCLRRRTIFRSNHEVEEAIQHRQRSRFTLGRGNHEVDVLGLHIPVNVIQRGLQLRDVPRVHGAGL